MRLWLECRSQMREKKNKFSQGYADEVASFAVLKGSSIKPKTPKSISLSNIDSNDQQTLDALKKAFAGKIIGVQTGTIHQNF